MTKPENTEAVTTYLAADADYSEAVATFLAAADAYAAALASVDVARAIAPTLSCAKVTVIAQMLEKAGHHEAADWWLFMHSTQGNIDEFDDHADYWKEADPWL
ncbi:hypothetical protein GRS96_19495 (plasmid) [Rathayibacter sp. VKM Ac-2803]|uniref:Uncharacterized protein n=1 Tax=Rathayibacter caricis DSM 15933 TaxID=1328867 RepID=A0A2T4UP31_9MICO|nr:MULTISPECIES: hypothetical protein [Rathayibacter]MWV51457.1 hypothetical protein [Rathayibacter sp. VKM Ac-2803]PTL71283.1 hypothetical protein C1I63_18820 [Rathayibacter caricis DSM 15933]